eukprot:scaffold2041_cov174-Ochromonas_danica.AAC.9
MATPCRRSRSASRPAAPAPRAAPAPKHTPPPPAAHPPAPAPAYHAPPPAAAAPQQSGGMLAGLGATMAQGFAFGTGSAIARNVVNSVMGGGSSSAPEVQQAAPAAPAPVAPVAAPEYTGPCGPDQKTFMECLQQNANNATNCDFYFNALQACQSRY